MKAFFFVVGFLSLTAVYFPTEVEASRNSYWQYWKQNYSNRFNRSYRLPTQKTESTTTTETEKTETQSTTQKTSGYRVYPTSSQRYSTSTNTTVRVTTRPYSVSPITEFNTTPVKIMQIGFLNPKSYATSYQEPVLIQSLGFEMTDISGSTLDPTDFELVVSSEEVTEQGFEFEKEGRVTLKFNNLRLANGENQYLDFSIRVKDPDTTPHTAGQFRIKLKSVSAQTESSQKNQNTFVSGRSVSNYVTLNPIAQTSGSGTIGGSSQQIYSKTLSAGEKAYVLSMNLSAHYDDFLVEEITVRNVYGNAVDPLIKSLNLVNFSTGQIIDQTRFINGEATFNIPRDAVSVNRNQQVQLGFQVEIAETIRSNVDSRFKLTIDNADLIVFGRGAGKYLPDSEKYMTLENKDFFIAQNAGGGVSISAEQPAFVSTGSLQEMYRFIIKNDGAQEISIGRLSLDVYLSGVEFPSGASVDDFELREIYRGQAAPAQTFSTTGVSGARVTFDALREVYIDGRGSKEFVLKLALNNLSNGRDENDSVNVKVLGDSSLQKGTLSYVRSQSPAFIWSDHSGRPHTTSSSDWFSGYLFPGLPTNNYVKYRR